MPTNFDFLKTDPQFASFADTAEQAELVLPVSPASAAMMCRTALEFAVKWLYSVDKSLTMPYDKTLVTLMSSEDFRDLLPTGLFPKIDYIRKIGNNATHNSTGVTKDQAVLALENLHGFMNFIGYCYGVKYEEKPFDKTSATSNAWRTDSKDAFPPSRPISVPQPAIELDFEALLDENFPKREKLSARRAAQLKQGYTVKPMDFTEDQTRKAYIDVMLAGAGWQRDKNWVDEYKIKEMPNKSGYGVADYVLFGDDGLPLAVIEAKRTSVNVEKGRQQAVLYANFLEKKFGRRPVIFLTNGYETRIWNDKYYPERPASGIYSKRDLEKEFNK
ncbi:MAG: DUF4145 domain-containing protein, partial [Peptococcaceae bacterium]|nr:DUF4145 domain-containing protein [Peptococcaceae bacterium]